jgi:putative component of membrane protein insertase Oxa1/YidC/SpoIIIJ protein YidD
MERRFAPAPFDAVVVPVGIALIRWYQRFVPSAAKRCCLLEPHCSEYARLALLKYGLVKGVSMSLARIRRCKPGLTEWRDYP